LVSNYSGFSTLVAFNTNQLLGLLAELLDFPAKAAHILYDIHVVLRYIVSHDIVVRFVEQKTYTVSPVGKPSILIILPCSFSASAQVK
jgi:hypothetical protein